MSRRLRLPTSSQMRATSLFQLRDSEDESIVLNEYAWGTWDPIDFPPDPSDLSHVVRTVDLGRLDLLAHGAYGNVALWWVIAHANDVTNQFSDDPDAGGMEVGRVLRIPTRQRVTSILAKAGSPSLRSQVTTSLTAASAFDRGAL